VLGEGKGSWERFWKKVVNVKEVSETEAWRKRRLLAKKLKKNQSSEEQSYQTNNRYSEARSARLPMLTSLDQYPLAGKTQHIFKYDFHMHKKS
jgi:hypothetical protein